MTFEERSLVHEDFESFGAIGRMNYDFIEGVGESGIFGRNFEEFLIIHDEDHAEVASFDYRRKEVTDIDRARAFFEKEMGVIETEDDVLSGISFVEDFDDEIFELALAASSGNEAGSVKGVNLAVFEAVRNARVGIHESFSK